MEEHEKIMRVLLGSLFAVAKGIDLGYTNQETLDMIALICDIVARKLEIELTTSQVTRLKEETAMFVVNEIIGEAVCEKSSLLH